MVKPSYNLAYKSMKFHSYGLMHLIIVLIFCSCSHYLLAQTAVTIGSTTFTTVSDPIEFDFSLSSDSRLLIKNQNPVGLLVETDGKKEFINLQEGFGSTLKDIVAAVKTGGLEKFKGELGTLWEKHIRDLLPENWLFYLFEGLALSFFFISLFVPSLKKCPCGFHEFIKVMIAGLSSLSLLAITVFVLLKSVVGVFVCLFFFVPVACVVLISPAALIATLSANKFVGIIKKVLFQAFSAQIVTALLFIPYSGMVVLLLICLWFIGSLSIIIFHRDKKSGGKHD